MKREMKLVKKVLKDGDKVFFTLRTDKYGRAEFWIEPVYKYGKIIKVIIYPQQQPDAKFYYVIENLKHNYLSIDSWTHKGFDKPDIWKIGYCKEHKTIRMYVYPPDNTNSFAIYVGFIDFTSNVSITFEKVKA